MPLQAQIPTTDLKLWLKADAGVVMDGSNYVSEWQDQSGNGNHAIQNTESRQPILSNNELNEKPVLRFDGVNDFLQTNFGETFTQPNTIFIIYNILSIDTTSSHSIIDGLSNGLRHTLFFTASTSQMAINAGPPSTLLNNKSLPIKYTLSTILYNTNNSYYYENGEFISNANLNSDPIEGLRIAVDRRGTALFLDGDIAEIIYYNAVLSNSEREQVEKYLMDKYSPPLDLGEDIIRDYGFCDTTLNVSPDFTDILWSTGETTPEISVNKSGTYWVQVTDIFNRIKTDTVIVEYPLSNVIFEEEFLCADSFAVVYSGLPESDDYVYQWNGSYSTHTITTTNDGDFWYTVTDNQGCSAVSDTISIETDYFPATFSLGNDTTLCSGNYFAAPYNAEWDYQWDSGENTYLIQIIDAGEYSITATDEYGCIAYDTIDIDIQGIAPQANFSFPENNCVNTGVVFNNQSTGVEITGYTWDFGDGSPISNEINPIHVYQNAGEYLARLEVYSASGCDNFIEHIVNVYNNPAADFFNSPVCLNSEVFFYDISHDSDNTITDYYWDFDNGNNSNAQNPVNTFSSEQEFLVSLEITNDKGCKDTITKTLNPATSYTEAIPANVLSPSPNYYTFNNELSFVWQQNPNTCVKYVWQISDNHDFSTISDEETFILSDNGIDWQNNTDNIEINKNLASGDYYWRILSYNPCMEEISTPIFQVHILNHNGVALHYSAEESNIEKTSGDSIISFYDISGNSVDAQQPNSNFRAIWVPDVINGASAAQFGENSASYYSFSELNLSDFTVIGLFNPNPPDLPLHYLLSGEDTQGVFTNGTMISGAGVFDGENILNSNQNYNHWQITTLTNDQIFVNTQEVNYASNTSAESLNLNILGSRSQALETQYFNGFLAELMIFNYKLSSDEINYYEEYLRQKYFPPVNLGQDLSLNCGECVYTINAPTGFVDYNWSTGETSSSITVNQSGTYTLTVTDIFGFTSSDEIYVECPQQSCYPAPDLGEDVYVEYGFCPVQIEVEDIYQNYLWSNGDTQASTSVNTNGTYFITVTSLDGYTFIDSISVFYPEINMQDTVFCYSEHMILDPDLEEDYSYLWSNSSMNSSIQIYNSGEYWVQITDTSNCEIIKTANVIVDNFQNNISLGNDTSLCSGNYIKLIEGAEETVNYTWLPGGETDSTLYIYENGEYILIAENINGCIASDTINIAIHGIAPVPDFAVDNFCFGSPSTFTDLSYNQDSISERTWIFNNTDTLYSELPQYTFPDIGINSVQLIVESFGGCIADTTIFIDVLESPQVDFTYFPVCTNVSAEFTSDASISEPETITELNWEIDGSYIDNSETLVYNFAEANDYLVSLTAIANNSCSGTYSETVSVQSSYPLPESFTLISPHGNIYENNITFNWEYSENAIYYRLLIAFDENFNDVITDIDSIINNSITLELQDLQDTVYWKVQAFNPCLSYAEAEVANFFYFSPDKLPGLNLWLSADSVETENNYVSIWYDKSGNEHHLTQDITSRQPIFVDSAINYKPVLYFNSDNMHIDFNQSFDQPNTIFTVYNNTSTASNQYVYAGGHNKSYTGSNQIWMWTTSSSTKVSIPYNPDGSYNIHSDIWNQSSTRCYINGEFKVSGNVGSGVVSSFNVGSPSSATQYFMTGNIAEIIFYNNLLSDEERISIENYLMDKYSPILDLGPDIYKDYNFCEVILNIHPDFQNILWSTGETTNSINIQNPGQYFVQVEDIFGRIQYDTINVYFPEISYPEQTSFCSGNNIIWDTQMGNDYSFEWSLEGETDSQITINEEGFYSVLITDTIGCQLQSDTLYFEENMYEYTTSIGPSDTTMCSGNPLALITNIEETENYLWSTGSTEDQIIVTESGTYSVTTTNIVGCIAISQTNVTISGTAPQADFELLGQCEQNIISFTDLSVPTGEEIISWEWKINGDVFSQQQNPEYIFSEQGTYNISLTVTSEGGCSNTKTQSINIYPKPVVSFTPENLCQNSVNSIYSTSYVDNGTIQENYWYINGNQYTADQIDITVENDDSFEIKLISVSEHGCSDSIVSSIETRNNPIPQFTFSPICEGASTYFNNNTQTEIYNPPLAYQWDFGDGGSSTISDPEYIYSASGEYDVSLEMSYNNGCSSTSTQTINIFANPSAEISNLNSCFGELYMPIDASVSEDGDIVSWKWVIERPELPSGYTTYYSQSPSFIPSDTGAYNIALTVNSEYGCTNTKNTSYNVWNSSMASFTASQTWGGVPFYVSFNNTSENAVDYFWDFGDDNTSTEQNTSHVYQDTGTFVVKLISFSENDCSDTASLQLNAVIPVSDILLLDFQVENVNNYLNCNVIVVNNGTLPVSNIEMIITIPAKGTFREILDYIESGETINYTFDTEIYYQGNGLPEIICVEAKPDIISNYYQDENPEDNVICLSSLNQLRAYPPYPNPADELLYFEFFSNQNSDIIIKMINGNGQIISSYSLISFYGYKKLELNLSNTPSGLYFLNITNGEEQFSYKFIKNN